MAADAKPYIRRSRGRSAWLVVASVLAASSGSIVHAAELGNGSPLLVELFTSEGCSSCPPADALLAQIANRGGDIIALSEHVTYWNHLGWSDPYSSVTSTSRQSDYVHRLGGQGPYTPQMVVDGAREFVGSDTASLRGALIAASARPKVALAVSLGADADARTIPFIVKLAEATSSGHLISVLVQNQGHQKVSAGENGGHSLTHVDIARQFRELAKVAAGHAFEGAAAFTLPPGSHRSDYHVVVFFQQAPGGPVLAAAST